MGPISAGVRQLPYSDAIVAQEKTRGAVTHDILSPVTAHGSVIEMHPAPQGLPISWKVTSTPVLGKPHVTLQSEYRVNQGDMRLMPNRSRSRGHQKPACTLVSQMPRLRLKRSAK